MRGFLIHHLLHVLRLLTGSVQSTLNFAVDLPLRMRMLGMQLPLQHVAALVPALQMYNCSAGANIHVQCS